MYCRPLTLFFKSGSWGIRDIGDTKYKFDTLIDNNTMACACEFQSIRTYSICHFHHVLC